MRGLKAPISGSISNKLYQPTAGDGCVLWLPGQDDPQSATIRDRSGKLNNGTIAGATWVRNSKGLQYLSFDGDDYVNCGTSSTIDFGWTTPFSIGCWINTSQASGSYRSLIGRASTSAGLLFSIWGTKADIFLCKTYTADSIRVYSSNAVNDGVWRLVFVTYDGSATAAGTKVYVDGVDKSTIGIDALTGEFKQTDKSFSMAVISGWNSYTGLIALPRAFNVARTAAQIASIYRQERSLFGV